MPREQQRRELDALARLNELHRASRADDSRLSARIDSFELAFRMQTAAPEAFDLQAKPPTPRGCTASISRRRNVFGKQCLLARRLVERGVRFVQLYHTTGGFQPWDQHSDLKGGHEKNALATDLPIAGLLQRSQSSAACSKTRSSSGAANSAARRPAKERPTAATIIPSASPCGWPAAASKAAWPTAPPTSSAGTPSKTPSTSTICTPPSCTCLGLDHERLTYRYAGRDFRLTDVSGKVVNGILT